MGDITGRPKAPQQQVVYVPQYIQTPASTTTTNTSSSSSGNASSGGEPPTPEQQREKNLLTRPRSRIGTILTGFRGILTPSNESDQQKKTLLGE